MCGFAGFISFEKKQERGREILREMCRVIVHRGPDDEGIYIQDDLELKERNWNPPPSVGLGHRRLSIIDLSHAGHQPMGNEDGTIWVVYNGEIYNFKEIKKPLQERGHVFRSNTDTEVIIHAYEEFGIECVKMFRGMFAFALWDEKNKKLFLVRDRLGIKPLYYGSFEKTLVFGSEIKSILQHPVVKRNLDPEALDLYLSLRYVPGPYTMYKDIHKLLPGCLMIVDHKGMEVKQYWDLEFNELDHKKEDDYIAEFEELLYSAIEMRLMSDVPLGVFLSGGIDSSMLVAFMKNMVTHSIKTFSIGYEEGSEENEFQYSKFVADKFCTEHYEFRITPTEFGDLLPKLVWYMDEPIADPAAVPLYYLSNLAKEYVTVVLSGEGADEILAGYYIYHKMLMLEKIRSLPTPMLDLLLPVMKRLLVGEKFKKYLSQMSFPLEERYIGVSSIFNGTIKADLTLNGPLNTNGHKMTHRFLERYFEKSQGQDALRRMLYLDTKVWLPDDLLMKADKMTMANSMELRVPLLDHKLVEFAAKIPSRFKIKRGETKYLLKKFMKKYFPSSFIYRKKKGFPVPIERWFKTDLQSLGKEVLLDKQGISSNYFNKQFLETILEDHRRGYRDYSGEIWALLSLEYWNRIFIKC